MSPSYDMTIKFNDLYISCLSSDDHRVSQQFVYIVICFMYLSHRRLRGLTVSALGAEDD